MTAIGKVLRSSRKARNLNLRELAALAEVSPSLLSQIENGKANPSVATLYSLAAALSLPPGQFFGDDRAGRPELAGHPSEDDSLRKDFALARREPERGATPPTSDVPPQPARNPVLLDPVSPDRDASTLAPVVRPRDRAHIELLGGVTWYRLTPSDEANVEFLEIVYDVGATSGEKLSRHSGREYGLVLEGTLLVELGFQRYTLSQGDSIAFDSSTPHRLANVDDRPARAVWVVIQR